MAEAALIVRSAAIDPALQLASRSHADCRSYQINSE